jgi:large subunit ribosomal protein L22
MEARAHLRYARIAPRKVSVVLDLIRGEALDKALAILQYPPKAASELLYKLVKSAAANAENNHKWIRTTCTSPSASSPGPHAEARDAPRAGPCVPYLEENEPYHGRAQRERVRR